MDLGTVAGLLPSCPPAVRICHFRTAEWRSEQLSAWWANAGRRDILDTLAAAKKMRAGASAGHFDGLRQQLLVAFSV